MEIKKLENSNVELTLQLKKDKIEESYNKKLQDYTKKLTLKGFRQGKAPKSLVENKYGQEIREEVVFALMEENLQETFKTMDEKDRPLPYSTPVLQNEDSLLPFKAGEDITYSVIYDVKPEFELPAYTGLEVEAETIKVKDEEVDKEIEDIREKNALIIAKEGTVALSDIVTIDYVELDENKNEIEKTKRNDFSFTVGSSYNFYKIDNDILGMKKGETKIIEKTYDDNSGMGTDYLGKTINLKVTVKELKTKEIPELNDEFAQDVKDSYKTLKDMKEDVRKNLEKNADETNKDIKLGAVLQKVAENTKIVLPQSLTDYQLEQEWNSFISQFGMDEEQVLKLLTANGTSKEQYKAQYFDSIKEPTISKIKNQLIIDKIGDVLKLEITDDEIKERLKEFGENLTEDNPNYDLYKEYVKQDLKFEKVQSYLIENNKFKNPTKKSEKKDEKAE